MCNPCYDLCIELDCKPEILGSSDRIIVMAEGDMIAVLDNDGSITQEDIMSYATQIAQNA